jgi:hypothetical protein
MRHPDKKGFREQPADSNALCKGADDQGSPADQASVISGASSVKLLRVKQSWLAPLVPKGETCRTPISDAQRYTIVKQVASPDTRSLDAKAADALRKARAMPPGAMRTEALKRAGLLQLSADSRGVIFAKRGRPGSK